MKRSLQLRTQELSNVEADLHDAKRETVESQAQVTEKNQQIKQLKLTLALLETENEENKEKANGSNGNNSNSNTVDEDMVTDLKLQITSAKVM